MIEYNMSAEMATEILKARKNEEKKLKPQEYLIKYVQEQFGLKGIVVKVSANL